MADLSVFGKIQNIGDIQRQRQALALKQMQMSRQNQPAALQIAREIERRIAAGDVEGAQLIADSAKMYDKGMLADFGGVPQQGVPEMPLEQVQQKDALYGQGADMPQPTGIRLRPGYAESKAQLEAAVKGAGQQAEKSVDLRMNPEIKKREAVAGLEGEAIGKPKVMVAEELAKQDMSTAGMGDVFDQLTQYNKGSFDAPYSTLSLPVNRFSWDEETKNKVNNTELLIQARTDLAAPLAKQLGVNPTDRDFQATLDRIFNVDSTKESRQMQIDELRKRVQNRRRALGEIANPVELKGASDESPNYKSKYGLE